MSDAQKLRHFQQSPRYIVAVEPVSPYLHIKSVHHVDHVTDVCSTRQRLNVQE